MNGSFVSGSGACLQSGLTCGQGGGTMRGQEHRCGLPLQSSASTGVGLALSGSQLAS